jgi:hypothetical protein
MAHTMLSDEVSRRGAFALFRRMQAMESAQVKLPAL